MPMTEETELVTESRVCVEARPENQAQARYRLHSLISLSSAPETMRGSLWKHADEFRFLRF